MRWTLDRVVQVQTLAGGAALCPSLYSHKTSLHSGVQMGTGEFTAGGNPAMK